MLTDEQLTEIWRRLRSIELTDLGEKIDGEFYLRVWPNDGLYRPGSVAQGKFIQNAPADIEALLIEVKRLRQLVTDHIAQPKPVSQTGLEWGEARAKQLRDLVDEIAREYNTPQHDRESTELPPVIEDQLDSGESE